MRLFADGTAIYLTLDDKGDSNTLQRDLDRLQAWDTRWGMKFNPSKCQVIRVASSRTPPPLSDSVYTTWTGPGGCQQCQGLGVDISSNLSWNTHIWIGLQPTQAGPSDLLNEM